MLTISQVTKSFGADVLFEEVSLQVNRGDRLGLIGANGSGKSTLFSLILGRDDPDRGTIQLQKNARMGFLPQENAPVGEETVLQLATLQDLKSLDRTPLEISSDPVETDFEREVKAKRVLSGLAFRVKDFDRPAKEFSGGWIMRAHLARLLVDEPDLLLLDEPTNHLDLETVVWLQKYLQNYSGALLLISHDRAFLNALVTRIVELDRQQLAFYTGNYDDFVLQKEARRSQQLAAYKNQQRQIDKLQTFIDRFGAKNTKAAQAQSKRKELARIERIDAPEKDSAPIHFRFPQPARSGARVITLAQVSHAYGETKVYADLNLEIERGQRTVLVGPNGAGKSTLMKLLAGVLPVQAGRRELGYNVELGYFSQHRVEMFDLSRTVLAEASDVSKPVPEQMVRSQLGAFLFSGDDVFKPVSVLSGGEKSRLALAKLLLDPPNFLVMDEPTTHLDMRSIEALISALSQYKGTLVFVSHDVHFIRSIATSVIHVQPGQIRFYPGGYEYFVEKTAADTDQVSNDSSEELEQSSQPSTRSQEKERKRLEAEARQQRSHKERELRAKLEQIEKRILELEGRQQQLVVALQESNGSTSEESLELKSVTDELNLLMPEWEQLVEETKALRTVAANQ
ncbi:MAG: ATP-binding cassette domain-containing protein [Verrucomicrobia bacterium]|nr:ATP-binding cassette domain-containing protein [Verrucomicrobiota bacterium]MBV8486002.1 ATP-binding cassette domain-containing protein [Verrucomicrobiota bacterium]